MVNYKCQLCQKNFLKKYNFEMHNKRKKLCVIINNDLLLIPPNSSDNIANSSNNAIKYSDTSYDIKIFKCDICDTIFKKKFNLDRHLNGRCIGKKENTKLKLNNQVNIDELDIDDKTKMILNILINQNKKLLEDMNKKLVDKMNQIKEENKEIKEENKEMKKK